MTVLNGIVLVSFKGNDAKATPSRFDEVTVLPSGALKTVGPKFGESPAVGKYTYGSQVMIFPPGSWASVEVVEPSQEHLGSLFVIDEPVTDGEPARTERLDCDGQQRMTKEQAVAAAERYIEAKGYDVGGLDVGQDLFIVDADGTEPAAVREVEAAGESGSLRRRVGFLWLATASGRRPDVEGYF